MIGLWVALGLAIAVLLLALRRPILAAMGVGYAAQRLRQTALIVAGLMIATTVIAAAGIAADSSGRSYTESILGRVYLVDGAVSGSNAELVPEDVVEAAAVDPSVRPYVKASAVAIRVELPVENAVTGLGAKDVAVWGIDPETFARVARWEDVEGRAPLTSGTWPDGAIVANQEAASRFGLEVGDAVRVFLGGQELVLPNTTVEAGRWELAAGSEATGQYVHHPLDQYQFTRVSDESSAEPLYISVEAPADVDVLIVVTGPDGEQFRSETGRGAANLTVTKVFPASEYLVEAHSPTAVQRDFTVTISQNVRGFAPERILEGPLVAVVRTEGSDPISFGGAVYVPIESAQSFLDGDGRANTLLVDFVDDADLAKVSEAFRVAANEAWAPAPARVSTDREALEVFRAELEEGVRALFLGIGSFSILAGAMLIGVLLALLVEERKHVLATARALGAQRLDLTRMHIHEGSAYALLAALAGLLAGGALAALVMRYVIIMAEDAGARFVLSARPSTVLSAMGWGFALVLIVISFAAYRATRINIVAALRGESEDRERRALPLVRGAVILVLGGAFLLYALASGKGWATVVGALLLAVGAAPILGRWLGRDLGTSIPAAALAGYLVWSFGRMPLEDPGDFILLPVRGVALAAALAVIAAYSGWLHRVVLGAFGALPRLSPLFRSALGHLRQRPGRAALTITMFATVLVVLTALGTLVATIQPNDVGDAGGFDVLVDTPRPLGDPSTYLAENPPASGVRPLEEAQRWAATGWIPQGLRGLQVVELVGDTRNGHPISLPRSPAIGQSAIVVTSGWIDAVDFRGADLAPGYGSLEDAFRAVERDATLVVLAEGASYYDFDRGEYVALGIGDVVNVGNDGPEVRIVGIVHGSTVAGAYVHPNVGRMVADGDGLESPGTRIWAAARGDPHDLADSFDSAFRRAGVTAVVVDDIDPLDREVTDAVIAIIQVFVGLGILVGMVSLALIMGRAVLVRRAEIGTLRALGAQPSDILVMISFEALYLALWSIAIGLAAGLLLAWGMTQEEGALAPALKIDWAALGTLYAITLVGAVLAAFVPAWRASRLPPAQAVRHIE